MPEVFLATFKVERGADSIMPDGAEAAYVTCFAGGQDYRHALRECAEALSNDGLIVAQVLEPVQAMDVSQWQSVVSENWPDLAAELPDQTAFEAVIAAGSVQYGPFGAVID